MISHFNKLKNDKEFEVNDNYYDHEIEETVDSGGINLVPTHPKIKKTRSDISLDLRSKSEVFKSFQKSETYYRQKMNSLSSAYRTKTKIR